MRLTVGPINRFALGPVLALALACQKSTPASQVADSAAASNTDSPKALVEIDSVAIKAAIPTVWPAAKEPQCADNVDVFDCYARQIEEPVMASAGARVKRLGDTLRLTTNARTLTWIDNKTAGEGWGRHFYEGTITARNGKRYAVVRHDQYEGRPHLLIDWISSDTVRLPDRPVLSPDSARIASGTFSDDGRLELEIWNIQSEPTTREFRQEFEGAGPVNIAWRNSRTIDFQLAETSGGRDSVPPPIPMVLTRLESIWKLARRN